MPKELSAEAQAMLGMNVSGIIKTVLASPMRASGEVKEADGKISLEELSASNTTVMTRLIMQMSYNATKGDVKAANFLFEHAGFDGNTIDDDSIVFIDDLSDAASTVPIQDVQDAEYKVLPAGESIDDDEDIELIDDM